MAITSKRRSAEVPETVSLKFAPLFKYMPLDALIELAVNELEYNSVLCLFVEAIYTIILGCDYIAEAIFTIILGCDYKEAHERAWTGTCRHNRILDGVRGVSTRGCVAVRHWSVAS